MPSSYKPWGRANPGSTKIEFRFARDDPKVRNGWMYPLARLDKVTWMDEEPERTGESIQILWLDFGRDTIKVAGGNLTGLRDALLLGTVDFIQQWDGSTWPEEPDEEGPVVWELVPTLPGVREREADGKP